MKTAWYSRPLALWSVIRVTMLSSSLSSSCSVIRRDLLEELLERRDLALALELAVGVELAGDADQLLEVLDPALGLDRALRLERLDVAGLVQHRLEQLGDAARASRPARAGARSSRRSGRPP